MMLAVSGCATIVVINATKMIAPSVSVTASTGAHCAPAIRGATCGV
jgi:hypothetical protein